MAKTLGILGVVLLLALGFWWLASGSRDDMRGLDRSALGTDGLPVAMRLNGLRVEKASPGTTVKVDSIGLRLLPIWDMDLEDDRPETVGDTTLRTISSWQVSGKLYQAAALVILPKWRWEAVKTGVAAPETAIPLKDYAKLLGQLGLQNTRLTRGEVGFSTPPNSHATLFMAQLFDARSLPETCMTEIGDGAQALVIRCENDGRKTWFLSDPDFANNHGLTLGDNAAAFADLLRWLRIEGKLIYLDPYPADYTVWDDSERQEYDRTSDDLWRFFKPPLGEIWAMLAMILALFLWRGGVRFGPVRREDEAGPDRSRREVVATRGRLIRLTGQDAPMVADYVRSDLIRMAEAAFGPGRAEIGRLWPLLARRDAARAEAFQRLCLDLMRGFPATPAALRRQLDTYHQLQRSLTHGHDA